MSSSSSPAAVVASIREQLERLREAKGTTAGFTEALKQVQIEVQELRRQNGEFHRQLDHTHAQLNHQAAAMSQQSASYLELQQQLASNSSSTAASTAAVGSSDSSSSSSSSTAEAATKPEMPSFGVGNSSDFELRTVGYKKHGVKAASAEPLYELVALDIFKTGRRVDRIHANLDLEGLDLPDTAHPDVPALFVMNVQFPREEQKMFTDGDGPGASVVFYFKITEPTLTELQGPSSERSNALKLLTEWCRVAPEDPAFRGRFKAMGFIDRIQDYGLPGVAARFNGKPILIKKTGSLFRGQVGHAGMIEMDVNVHRFAYATRSCLIAMKEKFGSMVIKVGFTIEGREDDELPEVLLGCANINGVDLDAAIDLF
mmetsp:Transcript_77622/g.155486  ORF Transcript_77622/g.155486 Transcript_77622/m.155486 type:complete len:372 (-) Transcript_77622:105-1220(-)